MRDKKYNLISAAGYCFKYAPGASLIKSLNAIIGGASMPLITLAVAFFIDNSIALANGGGKPAPVIAAIVFIAAYYAYAQISRIIIRIADKTLENALRENLRPQLVQKQARISFALLETPETSDLTARVCEKAEPQITAILNSGINIIRLGIQIFGILALLAVHVWQLPLLFIISAAPVIIIARKGGKAVYLKDAAITKLTRELYYLSGVLAGRETAAERALFGYSDNINKKFSAVHLKRSDMNTKNIAVEHIAINACGLIVNALVIVSVFALLRIIGDGGNNISHGLFISLTGALIGLARTITGAVANFMWEAAEYIEYMRDYTKFFALPETGNNIKNCGKNIYFESLEIRNLKFKYTPESDYVLNGVNLIIKNGKSYSLIGQNGAGKSTLTKILLGLYRDFENEILINGINISEYNTDALRRIFSIVYQDFAKYYITLGDNITLGDARGDLGAVLKSAELGEVIAKLPERENTPLGKIYNGGADISGGEWQKVAIARALYADAPFMILDEPTASLGPMTESKLYKRFAEIAKTKTALLISHRLGSTKLSDILFVLDGGVIAETGTHDELMAAGGIYAEMFKSQRSWYHKN